MTSNERVRYYTMAALMMSLLFLGSVVIGFVP